MSITNTRTNREIDEGKRISAWFLTLSKENKRKMIAPILNGTGAIA